MFRWSHVILNRSSITNQWLLILDEKNLALIIIVFILGYVGIASEHVLGINKAAIALMTGVACWTVYIVLGDSKEHVVGELARHVGELSQILFFLMGAMAIVELIDAHDGFEIITQKITTTRKRKLLWIISVLTFVLSSVLNNLTTAIVMCSLIRKLMKDKTDRMMMAGAAVW